METPVLLGFDHVHIYVKDRIAAESWYRDVLGLHRVAELEEWAADGGPLTLADGAHLVHLAVFERADHEGSSVVAFNASADGFLLWKTYLEAHDLTLRIADHGKAFSMYFHDPDANMYEITCYDHDIIRSSLSVA